MKLEEKGATKRIRVNARARVVRKEASACPASRKYGRTKIPHVRREFDEKEGGKRVRGR